MDMNLFKFVFSHLIKLSLILIEKFYKTNEEIFFYLLLLRIRIFWHVPILNLPGLNNLHFTKVVVLCFNSGIFVPFIPIL